MLKRVRFPLFAAIMAATSTPALAQMPAPAPLDAAAAAKSPAATALMDRLWPTGTYRKLMDGTMQNLSQAMFDQALQVRAAEISPEHAGKLGDKTIAQLIDKEDPAFRERMRITNDVMFAEMMPLIDRAEPNMRSAMARIYARKFDAGQLSDLERFFATPTGEAYAREWLISFMDPEIMSSMQSFTPELMKAMPDIMKKVQAATSHLPPPPKPKKK